MKNKVKQEKRVSSSGLSLKWPLLAFLAMIAINAILSPSFLSITLKNGLAYGSLIDIALHASPLIIVALGATLVIATGGIDLSVGAIAALAASVMVGALAKGWGFAPSLSLALLTGIATGLCNGLMVVGLGLQPIVASLVTMITGRGLAQLILDGQIEPVSDSHLLFIGTGHVGPLPFSILLALISLAVFLLVMRKTAAGLFIEAIGNNAKASRLVGLNAGRITIATYAISGLMAAIAGLVLSSNIHAVDVNNLGLYLELDAILSVVIGGTLLLGGRFTLLGSVLGSLIVQTVSATINSQGVPVQMMLMVKAAVVILVCLLQSKRSEHVSRIWQKVRSIRYSSRGTQEVST